MDTNKFFIPSAVVLAGLFIAGAVYWNGAHPSGAPSAADAAVDVKNIAMAGEPFIGDEHAPATLVEWSDYQCPFCKRWELDTMPVLVDQYVKTGKLRIVFKDFAFLGRDSITAAEYGRAVWKLYPEKYFDWRTAMFNAQDEEGDQDFGNAASIDKLDATIAGLDAAKIKVAVAANAAAYDAAAQADKAEAQKFGISATPSFIIGTQLIAGAYPTAAFSAAIDQELKAK